MSSRFDARVEAQQDPQRTFDSESSMFCASTKIARFVETQLGPSDMVALMYPLEPVSAVRMTRNHDAVAAGVGREPVW